MCHANNASTAKPATPEIKVIGVFNAPANQRSTLPMDIVIPKKMKSPEFPLNSGLHVSHVSKITLPKLESIEPLLTA